MFRLVRNLLLVLCVGLLGVDVSMAGQRGSGAPPPGSITGGMRAWEARPYSDAMSLSEAIDRAQSRFPGRVVKAETKGKSGRRQHVIRIINDQGRVRTFRIDAQTGEFL